MTQGDAVPLLTSRSQQPEARPLYQQVQEKLIQRVVKGEWGPGEILPSEIRLAAEYNVHQGTVRKALDDMAARNLVVRQQGKGTFVAAVTNRHNPFHFFRLRARSDVKERPVTEFHSITRGLPTAAERAKLALGDRGTEVVRAVKVRKFDDRPVILERIAYPADLFPALDKLLAELKPDTTYGLLEEKYRVLIARVAERVTAIPASAADAKKLGVKVGEALLAIDRVAVALDGRIAEWRLSHCRTEAHEYYVEHT